MKITLKTMKSSPTGFTLVETLVTTALVLVLCGAIFSALSIARNCWQSSGTQLTVQQEARRGINEMIKELRQTAETAIIDVPADGINYNSITFRVPQNIAAGGITWSTNINYSISSGRLIRTKDGIQRTLANNIAAISFTRNPAQPEVINIIVSITKQTFPGFAGTLSTITLSSQIKVRN